jgi:hypothetical protein
MDVSVCSNAGSHARCILIDALVHGGVDMATEVGREWSSKKLSRESKPPTRRPNQNTLKLDVFLLSLFAKLRKVAQHEVVKQPKKKVGQTSGQCYPTSTKMK